MSAYGRVDFVTESKASEIRAVNKARQTEERNNLLKVRRKLDDRFLAKSCGITLAELNKSRLYQ